MSHRVLVADALTALRRESFDALVPDVMPPGGDGLAVCRVVRADRDHTAVGAGSKNLAVSTGDLRRTSASAGAPTLIRTVRGVGDTVRRP